MQAQATQPASPCIRACLLDSRREYCTGCLRTLGEIRGWGAMSDDERLQVMQALAARRLSHD
ncbi:MULTISPECIES: DUF1289 domain-containing protein [Methylobacillus]|uniref:Fe-S protein n=1 Tax=Methylobacillus flagellatus (strain ATCC 51484 / DSM 6875 / VKM B-1610 / KT) TaxID=265072 RepID=Q1GZ37_METFK|nr:protein of unknown function DUF1289 [Methylobacillus flagellatus KT]MPS49878.1 DUF1289 domain-containing protein [Methylobacillus sp.]